MGRSKGKKAKIVRPRYSTGDQSGGAQSRTRRPPSPLPERAGLARSNLSRSGLENLPTVSICTVTHNRDHLLPLLETCILNQTYPRELLEWVIVDDSDPQKRRFKPTAETGLKIRAVQLDKKLVLGQKRNLSHRFCVGDVVVYMDDDEFYPPRRVEHAVEMLQSSGKEIAGSTETPILFIPECELWMAGPYGDNHATANTFAFRRTLLEKTQYDDEAAHAEEKFFLKDYKIPMVQLDPIQTIICFGHGHNTFDKRRLIGNGLNSRMKKVSDNDNIGAWIDLSLLESYIQAHDLSPRPAQLHPTYSQTFEKMSMKQTLFLISSPQGSGERLIFKMLGQLGATLIVGRGDVEELFSLQLLTPKSFEPRASAAQIQQVLQHFSRLLRSRREQEASTKPFVLRDPKAALLLHELSIHLDLRLIICLRPLTEIVTEINNSSASLSDDSARKSHRLYGHLFATLTNTLIPYQLVRYHDLVNNSLAVIQELSEFCGLTPSDQQIHAAQQIVANDYCP